MFGKRITINEERVKFEVIDLLFLIYPELSWELTVYSYEFTMFLYIGL